MTPADLIVRRADADDAATIAQINRDCIRASHTMLYSADEMDSWPLEFYENRWRSYLTGERSPNLALAPRVAFLAHVCGEPVGFSACHHTTKWNVDAELQSLHVLQEHQRHGIGTLLFAHCVRWARDENRRSLGVDVALENPYRTFYIKHGGIAHDPHTYAWHNLNDLQTALRNAQ